MRKKNDTNVNYKGDEESFKDDDGLAVPGALPNESVLAGFPLKRGMLELK